MSIIFLFSKTNSIYSPKNYHERSFYRRYLIISFSRRTHLRFFEYLCKLLPVSSATYNRHYMKNLLLCFILVAALASCHTSSHRQLVILHTNDTHSQIDPLENGDGGLLRRKVVIDSIRATGADVLLIDAGDVVQGTMYFTLYKGEVEYSTLDMLGYDIAVLGNHDFDNKVNRLAENLRDSKVTWLSANYDFSGAPGLDSVFTPSVIKEYAGKKIGIFGINLNPKGMIAEGNYDGITYLDAYTVADSIANDLKENHKADYVIAVTHIGYDGAVQPNDVSIAAASKNIDLIIGGHSHTVLDPEHVTDRFNWKHVNAAGDTIAVVQAGAKGAYVGKTTLDLDNGNIDYSLIKIDSRLDDRLDKELEKKLLPYRHAVDSVMGRKVAVAARVLDKNEDGGLTNFLADFVAETGERLSGKPVDMGLINSGGVRRALPVGDITQGMIIDMLPFDNRIVVLDISGRDLLAAFDVLAQRNGSDGVSSSVKMTFNPTDHTPTIITINGQPISPERRYRLATIDYLANGGDYMTSLPNAVVEARSNSVLYDELLGYLADIYSGTPIDASPVRRMAPAN